MAILSDTYTVRDYARDCHELELRNRLVLPSNTGGLTPRCRCGNLLTITDRGNTCRQCILEGRLK